MKFLCLDCDQPMKLHSTEGPDEGSLAVTFRCPECGFRVAMLTNPFETQMVRSLGVKVGGRTVPPEPFENLRSTMAGARPDAFEGAGGTSEAAGPGCPFAAALGDTAAAPARAQPPHVDGGGRGEAGAHSLLHSHDGAPLDRALRRGQGLLVHHRGGDGRGPGRLRDVA